MNALVVFAVAAVVTYGFRVSMVVSGFGERLSEEWTDRLALVAPVMLSAIVAGSLFVDHGDAAAPSGAQAASVVAALVAVRRTGSLNAAFVVGVPTFWVMSALGFA